MALSYQNFIDSLTFTHKGRATRSQFWSSTFFITVYGVVFSIACMLAAEHLPRTISNILYGLMLIWYLVSTVIFLQVGARRLHDTGKSGWWLLIYYVASAVLSRLPLEGELAFIMGIGILIYFVVILVFLCTKSDPIPNKYGDPVAQATLEGKEVL